MKTSLATILAAALLLSAISLGFADSRTISLTGGVSINRAILGQPIYSQGEGQRVFDVRLVQNTSMRGVAGGLWADSYDWKRLTGDYLGPQTTLDMLRESRDKNSEFMITANLRGIGNGNTDATFVYTDTSTATCAQLAADWARYTNFIVRNYRQGDPISGRDAQIVSSLVWTGDKLLKSTEDVPPKVQFWEIGNEPEVGGICKVVTVQPADFVTRYKAIAAAMLAEDPSIKVGPCLTSVGTSGNAWLTALLADPQARVDFIGLHPYGPLYWITKNVSGGVLNATDLESGLNYMKQQQQEHHARVVAALTTAGRDVNTPLFYSEFNPSSWEGTYYYNLSQTVANALGVPETIFTFAELGIREAAYWDHPNQGGATTRETPAYKAYEQLLDYMGDTLLDSYVNGSFRLYTTKDSRTGRIVIWALNMSDANDWTIDIQLSGWSSPSWTGRRMTLGTVGGDTGLVMRNVSSETINWVSTDLTSQIDPHNPFTLTFEDSTITTIIIDPVE